MVNKFEIFNSGEAKETVEISFEKAAREIKDSGYRFHQQAHDKEGADPKIYHTSEHPRTLERRAGQMAETLRLSSEQRAVVDMAIAWHDTIIEYDEADPTNLLAMIRRHRGAREGDKPKGAEGNEGKSARLLEQEMRKANERAKAEIFSEDQIRTAMWAIDATYPDVNLGPDFKGAKFKEYPYYEAAVAQNPEISVLIDELETQGVHEGSLFFQPHLEKPLEEGQKVPREVMIVALSDLGHVGVAEKEEFFREGDNEMRELYANLRKPDVMRRLVHGDEERDRADREKASTEFLGWEESQLGFAMWQALRFEKILHLLRQQNEIHPEEEQKLRLQFSHFTDNIRAANDRAKNLKAKFEEIKSTLGEKAAFVDLAQDLQYETGNTKYP